MTQTREAVKRCVLCGAKATARSSFCDECAPVPHGTKRFAGNPWPSTPASQIQYDGCAESDLAQHIADQEDDAT